MPSRICHLCTNELQRWEELKIDVKKAQIFLNAQLKQKKKRKMNEVSDLEIFGEHSADSEVEYTPPCKKKKLPSILKKVENVKKVVPKTVESLNFICSICDLRFKNFKQFTEHQVTHIDSNNHCIDSDPNIDSNIIDIDHPIQFLTRDGTVKALKNREIRVLSPHFPYKCGLCPSKYKESLTLAEHLQRHVEKNKHLKSFPCPFCKIFVRKISNLIEHIEQHVENPYKKLYFNCEICDKHYASIKNLNTHMKTHDEFKKYVCSYCDMSYKYKSLLADHMEKHRLEAVDSANNEINSKICTQKLPTCGVCLQFFNDYEQLREHVQIDHITIIESVYPCGNCSAKSKSLDSIISHITHKHIENVDEEVIFTCEICIKDFPDSNSFNLHYKTIHKGKLIHDCPFCKIIFTDIETLKNHVARSHHTINEKKCRKIAPKPSLKILLPRKIQPIAPKIDKDIIEHLISYPKPVEVLYISNANNLIYPNENNDLGSNNILMNEMEPEPNVVQINITDFDENGISNENSSINYNSYFDHDVEDGYPCGLCHQIFNNSTDLLKHSQYELEQLKNKQIPCGYCGCMFKKIEVLLSHTEDHIKYPTRNLTHQCNICSKRFYLKKNYIAHKRSHSEIRRFKCNLCDNAFKHKMSWKVHFLSIHKDYKGDENEACIDNLQEETEDTVEINVEKLTAIAKNIETVNNKPCKDNVEEHYSCDICNCKYFISKELYGHYLEKHFDPNILKCELCIDILQTPEDLILHLEKHSKVKKHFCPICGKDFKNRGCMTEHIYLHSNERKYKCEQCIRSYRSRTSLSIHKRRDHGEGTEMFTCEICSNKYTSKAQLKRHILAHNGIFPFTCSTCGKGFDCKFRLVSHEYTHTSIKPLRCLKCNKGFICKKYWRNHMRKICNVPENDIIYFRPRFFDGKRVIN
jgi:KRAB domain-containing zinc finger protein